MNTVPYVFVFFLIETPFYHYKNRDVSNMFKCLVQICQVNFPKKEHPAKIKEIRNALKYGEFEDESKNVNIIDMNIEENFEKNKKQEQSKENDQNQDDIIKDTYSIKTIDSIKISKQTLEKKINQSKFSLKSKNSASVKR